MVNAFAFSTRTADGVPLLVGGLHHSDFDADALKRRLTERTLLPCGDAFFLDYQLQSMLQSACQGQALIAIGASAFVPGLGECGGGVIGSVEGCESVAETGAPIPIDAAFSLFAFPGRFGMVCAAESAQTALRKLRGQEYPTADEICMLACSRPFLFVSDGSGPSARGMLIAGDRERTVCLRLPENE